jgi:hypothetical protein
MAPLFHRGVRTATIARNAALRRATLAGRLTPTMLGCRQIDHYWHSHYLDTLQAGSGTPACYLYCRGNYTVPPRVDLRQSGDRRLAGRW